MKQTAVEWLVEKIQQANPTFKFDALIREAKEMEKEQIIESYCIGCAHIIKENNIFPRETSEQYYNETFKSE